MSTIEQRDGARYAAMRDPRDVPAGLCENGGHAPAADGDVFCRACAAELDRMLAQDTDHPERGAA